jgi:hypothetical protein
MPAFPLSSHPDDPFLPCRRRLHPPSRSLLLNFQPILRFVGRRRSRFLKSSRQKPANSASGISSFLRHTIPSMASLSPTWRQDRSLISLLVNLTGPQYAVMAEVLGRYGQLASESVNCSAPDTGNMGESMAFTTRNYPTYCS